MAFDRGEHEGERALDLVEQLLLTRRLRDALLQAQARGQRGFGLERRVRRRAIHVEGLDRDRLLAAAGECVTGGQRR